VSKNLERDGRGLFIGSSPPFAKETEESQKKEKLV
jgi:hypothetical protein